MRVVKVLSVKRYKCGYEVRREVWQYESGSECTEIKAAYTPDGDYIGGSKEAYYYVVKRGIHPVKRDPKHCACSIGYSTKDGKWYGWSHRAIFGFKVGSKCKRGDCHYMSKKDGGKGTWTAKTTADAKEMACSFAESVS